MRRALILTVALALAGQAAHAAPKQSKKKPAAARTTANQKAVSELMGPWKWGMTVEETLGVLAKQLQDRAAPELAKINDVYERTRIAKDIRAEVDVVRRSLIRFEGQRTGWDVSIIEGEFLHRNGESMMRYKELDPATGRDQERFFFFKDGKLWKQFIAFNMEAYKGKTFDDFRGAMEARYGKGEPITRRERDGKEKLVAVAWHAPGTYLRAVDLMQFYANFCLAFSDAEVERQMEAERLARAPKTAPPRAVVSDGGDAAAVHDPNADVVERITAQDSATRP